MDHTFTQALYGSLPSGEEIVHGFQTGIRVGRLVKTLEKLYSNVGSDFRKGWNRAKREKAAKRYIQGAAMEAAKSAPSGAGEAAGHAVAAAARRHVIVTGRVAMSSVRRGKRLRGRGRKRYGKRFYKGYGKRKRYTKRRRYY